MNVEFGSDEQSTPEKSASIVRVSALPTLSNVPVHPRGDGYSPWVLMRAGGWFDGVIALVDGGGDRQPGVLRLNRDPERLQIRPGTASNVQVT